MPAAKRPLIPGRNGNGKDAPDLTIGGRSLDADSSYGVSWQKESFLASEKVYFDSISFGEEEKALRLRKYGPFLHLGAL
jgi:hypothetical protein